MGYFKSFHPYAMTTILCWSLGYVLTRLALRTFSAFALGFLRYGTASLALLLVCLATRMGFPRKRDLPWFAASGITGFFLYMIAFNLGTGSVTAATSSFVIATVPVFTALLVTVFFRERLRAHQWLAAALELAGILMITMYGAAFTLNAGVLWLLLAAVLLSCYNLLQRKLTRTYSALQSTTYSIFAGTILLALFSPRAAREVGAAPPESIMYVLLLGVLCGAVAYIAWSKAFERAPLTSLVSNYMFFTPFITAILGFLLAGETPEPSTWIGARSSSLGRCCSTETA